MNVDFSGAGCEQAVTSSAATDDSARRRENEAGGFTVGSLSPAGAARR